MKVVCDPVPGALGPGRLYASVEHGLASEAYVSATLGRGFEGICLGRPVEDLSRIATYACGADSMPHALAAVGAVEDGTSIASRLPQAAFYLRNLMSGLDFAAQHLAHTYTVFLPSLVTPAMLDAAARMPASGEGAQMQEALFTEARRRYAPYGAGAQVGSAFTDALRLRRQLHRAIAAIGGRYPPQMTIVPGGVAGVPTQTAMATVMVLASGLRSFVEEKLLGGITLQEWASLTSGYPQRVFNDLMQRIAALPGTETTPEAGWGDLMLALGLGCELCATEYLEMEASARLERLGGYPASDPSGAGLLSAGLFPLPDGKFAVDCAGFTPIYEISKDVPYAPSLDALYEHLKHSYYSTAGAETVMTPGLAQLQAPADVLGVPIGDPQPGLPYSWSTAPRYQNRPCEVGPMARMVNLRDPLVMGLSQVLAFRGNSPVNVLAREVARIQELVAVTELLGQWLDEGLPSGAKGVVEAPMLVGGSARGAYEGPRGTFVHYVTTDGEGAVSYYHTISANAWNLSPRDAGGVAGPAELAAAYQGPNGSGVGAGCNLRSETGILDAELEAMEPWGLLSTLRSYAPCFSCAGH